MLAILFTLAGQVACILRPFQLSRLVVAKPARCGTFSHEELIMSAEKKEKPPGLQRNPDEWKTGDEPMTAAQTSYLHTLAKEANEEVPANLTKAEAAKRIEELQRKTGRGQPSRR